MPVSLFAQEPVKEAVAHNQAGGGGGAEAEGKTAPPIVSNKTAPEGPSSASVIAGAVGAVVAAVIIGLSNYWGKRADERNSIRSLAVQLALEQWKAQHALQLEAYQQDRRDRNMPPSLKEYTPPQINFIVSDMGKVVKTLAKTK